MNNYNRVFVICFGELSKVIRLNNYIKAKGVKEAIQEDGFIGILTGGLKATAGGITAAITAGLLMSVLFKAKDKA